MGEVAQASACECWLLQHSPCRDQNRQAEARPT